MGYEPVGDKIILRHNSAAWILMFYSMPSKPERNRLRIYRKLQKEGTLALKDGVHLLPFSEDRLELFMWLHQEMKTLGGEMHFSIIEKFETLNDEEIIALFKLQAETSYKIIEQKIKKLNLELPLNEATSKQEQNLEQAIKKIARDFESIHVVDFFESYKGKMVKESIKTLQAKLHATSSPKPTIGTYNAQEYKHKVWQTRKKSFVDRMASAWLIKRHIDTNATFIFDDTIDISKQNIITYDMSGATFTHVGDLCTYEVLLQSFLLHEDVALEKIGKIIHNLDLNDDKYITPEADGIKMILSAIRNNEKDDNAIIEKSHEIFDYLYLTLKK